MGLAKNELLGRDFINSFSDDDVKVEKIKFKNEVDKEYHRQKIDVANKWCRHLKKIDEVKMVIPELDTIETYKICSQCGARLLPEEIKKIKDTLKNFKK